MKERGGGAGTEGDRQIDRGRGRQTQSKREEKQKKRD